MSTTKTAAPEKKAGQKTAAPEKKAGPNDVLDLSGFNYKALKGEMFKEYVALAGDLSVITIDDDGNENNIVGKLVLNEPYDYQLFRMKPIFKMRFPGVKDSPKDLVGLEMKNDEPLHTTRITVATALNYNKQIDNAHGVAGHGKYYLLKK